jgi:integral membrane protein (TIGR01906 family)
MSGQKLVGKILSWLSAFVLLVILLLTVVQYCVFDLNFYRSEFNKLHSTEVIGISEQDLMRTTEGLLAYIRGERDNLNLEAVIYGEQRQVFNQKEITHMADVQKLYANSHRVRNGGIVVLLVLLAALLGSAGRKFFRVWAGGYLAGAAVFFCFLGILAIAITRDFYDFWNSFHMLFFTNDLWLLNPETDILIQIVPEQFFFDLVVRILVIFVLLALLLAVGAAFILFRKRKSKLV